MLPFNQDNAHHKQVELIIPKEVLPQIKPALAKLEKPRYARVYMSPSSLLEHEFFNTYIKSGNDTVKLKQGSVGWNVMSADIRRRARIQQINNLTRL